MFRISLSCVAIYMSFYHLISPALIGRKKTVQDPTDEKSSDRHGTQFEDTYSIEIVIRSLCAVVESRSDL
jgi:hypothetical protein